MKTVQHLVYIFTQYNIPKELQVFVYWLSLVNDGSYLESVNNGDIVFSNKEVYVKRTSDFNVISICQKLKMMKKPELVLIRDQTFCEIIPFRPNINSTISDLKKLSALK